MLMTLVRIPLTLLFAYSLVKWTTRSPNWTGGDMIVLLGYALFGAIVMAILWAPVVGEKLSDPLTSTITQETSLPPHSNSVVDTIQRLQWRGYHRLALVLVFIEGMRHPDLPQAALLGLRSARPGSFLEKSFAKEVYKFNNVQNCLHAYKILTQRHGMTPPVHKQPEVNLAILNLNRKPPPAPAKLRLVPKSAPAVGPARNQRIKLFEQPGSAAPPPPEPPSHS